MILLQASTYTEVGAQETVPLPEVFNGSTKCNPEFTISVAR